MHIINNKNLTLGVCYYPEHWPKTMWRDDLSRMKASGIDVIRIAEFAWNLIEPTEGQFTYEFFDEFLNLAAEYDMKVIFCTPTATPPAWLTSKYPEVLNANIDGLLYHHGTRRHYNYNSKVYNELSARIVEHSASHYAKHPAIIGWQIDNEFNCEINEFYSEADTLAFRVFLQNKYNDLDTLNKAWGTVFWNQTYTSWDEVFVPRKTSSYSNNPHVTLDYYRFISDSACRFAKMQSDILRKYIKEDDFITTNGIFGHLDYQRLNSESLDFITYDSYPNFAYCLDSYKNTGLKDRWWSKNLSEVRAISPNFGIMEQQSGANGWNTRMEAPTPRPGQLSLWTMQSVAHGADFVSYFRWRTCTFGTEIYWHGILDYSGRDNERLREVVKVSNQFKKLQCIAGAKYYAQVGVIKDYDNAFDSEIDVWHKRVEQQSQDALFTALQTGHTPFDYLYIENKDFEQKLFNYKVVFYPHPTIMTQATADILSNYVANGGIIIFGCRSAYKDINGQCVMDKLPGVIANLTGADVFEYSFIEPDMDCIDINWKGRSLKAEVFVDRLQATGNAGIEATYESDYYAGDGALVSNTYGNGRCYYYGTAFNEEAVHAFLEETGVINPMSEYIEASDDIELAIRSDAYTSYIFVLNYMKEPRQITLKKDMKELISDSMVTAQTIDIEPYGYRIFTF